MNIIDMIKSGQNPQQLVLSLLAQHNDPMSANLMRLAQAGEKKKWLSAKCITESQT